MHFKRKFLVIADSATAPGWSRVLSAHFGPEFVDSLELPAEFFERKIFSDWFQLKQYFNRIVIHLDKKVSASDLRNLIVFIPAFVELPDNKHWNPRYYSESGVFRREHLFSWLLLAFPEVRFVFYGEQDELEKMRKKRETYSIAAHPRRLHLISPLESPIDFFKETDFSVLFDPSGWRDSIREHLKPPRERHPGVWRRKHWAVVIEDEVAFSQLCGYAAYRYGNKTWVVQNMRQAENLLGKSKLLDPDELPGGPETEDRDKPAFRISLEDLSLGFPDKDQSVKFKNGYKDKNGKEQGRLTDINERSRILPGVTQITNRFIVTYGGLREREINSEARSLQSQIKEYNKEHGEASRMSHVYKPLSDITALSKKTRLYRFWRKTRDANRDTIGEDRKKTAGNDHDHSADGMLLDIAGILIERSKKLLDGKNPIPDLVQSALLASEAKELLGGKTPTISLEALSLQHRAEVLIECRCYGTDYDLDVHARAMQISKEVELICRWYLSGRNRALAQLGASLNILGELSKIYSDYKQIEELDQCQIEIRRLIGLLFMHRHPIYWPFYPIRWYFEFLQCSFRHFFFAVLCWYIFFLVLWCWYFSGCGQSFGEIAYSVFDHFWGRNVPEWVSSELKDKLTTRFLSAAPFIIGLSHITTLIFNAHARTQRK